MANDERPIIPGVADIIGAAKNRLVEVRPSAAPHVEQGEWSHVLAGWRGQASLARSQIADEVKAARLPFAEGQALTELAASEYHTERRPGASKAIGEVILRRTVVHAVKDATITAANATDGDSAAALLEAIAEWANAHRLNVYNPATGRGAHVVADPSTPFIVLAADMGQLCATANTFKAQLNWHFGNKRVYDGAALLIHKDPDPFNTITVSDAFASASGSAFSANSTASQQSLLLLLAAIKAACNAHALLEARGGNIRKGHQFIVAPNPSAVPPVTGGQYVVTVDGYAKVGQQEIQPPVEAIVEGPGSNLPLWAVGGPTLTITSTAPLFDVGSKTPFKITGLRAVGGSFGQTDEELREAASGGWTGAWGPTLGALTHGALLSAGVHIVPLLENLQQGGKTKLKRGTSVIYPTDVSWAWSATWSARVERELRDTWLGFGCRLRSGRTVNRLVRVEATVALRNADALVDPTNITVALRTFCQFYFDIRPDFYVWRRSLLRAILSGAHDDILSCTEVKVLDQDGVVLDEPAQPEAGDDLVHWVFADGALDVTYVGPG